jgi:predicted nuclease of predicted toxin-antitoxin system
MKLLLDQGLPRSLAVLLRSAGHDAVHVGEVGLSKADDAALIEFARTAGRIVVSMDADFHAHLALSNATSPSVIRVRIEGLKAGALLSLLQTVLRSCRQDLSHGAAVSVLPNRVRVRRLPLPQITPP